MAGIGVTIKLDGLLGQETIDQRIAKIDAARQSLSEAVEAVDSLKVTAEQNKLDLQELTTAIERAESEKASLHVQLAALKDMAAMDGDAVRTALKLPTSVDIWRERIISFLFGIGASVAAAFVWEFGIKRAFGVH
jgi:3-methyladenine DNA glycosylase/8-oxoguanine DNA glycosylase